MRVLVVTPWWPRHPEDQEGSFIRDQVEALRRLGTEVDVLAIAGDLAPRPEAAATLPFRWLPRYLFEGGEARALATLLGKSRLLRGRYDVVHAHEVTCGIACFRALGDVPLVVTIHGFVTHPRANRSKLRRRDMLALARRSRIVVVGEPLLAQDWIDEGRPVVVPNGYDAERFTPSPFPPGEILRVTSVSNLYPSKGVDVTIRATAALRTEGIPVELTVAGDGPERRSLEQLVRRLDLADHVTFLGRVTRDRVAMLLRDTSIMCLPSSPEAFGVAYLEALATGRPVVACEGEGPAGFVEDGRHGWLVPPGDVAAVTEVLRQAAANPQRLATMGKAGSETAQAYSWTESARRLLTVYREEAR